MKQRVISLCLPLLLAGGVVGTASPARATVPSVFDSSFGVDGIARLTIPTQKSKSAATRVIHDTDGNILALFQLDPESRSPRVIIARYLPTGSPDTSFGTNGRTLPVLLRDADMAVSSYTH